MYPVIVIGPPRSGTTQVAKVLQDFFGVLMDGRPKPPPRYLHKFRWLEDSRLIEMNWLFSNGFIGIDPWTRRFKRFIKSMQRQRQEWGFKDPRIIPLLRYAISFFDSPTLVRCHREKELVIKSYVEKLKWTEEKADKYYDSAERAIDEQLKNITHYRIDFGRQIQEEEIIELLQGNLLIRHAT